MTYVHQQPLGSATAHAAEGMVVVMAVGDPDRGDGAVGLAVLEQLASNALASRLHLVALGAQPSAVVRDWRGADIAVVVGPSAVGARPAGAIHHVEIDTGIEGAELMAGRQVAAAVALGRAIGHLPRRLVLLTVEGGTFNRGDDLSIPVRQAVERVVAEIEELVRERPDR